MRTNSTIAVVLAASILSPVLAIAQGLPPRHLDLTLISTSTGEQKARATSNSFLYEIPFYDQIFLPFSHPFEPLHSTRPRIGPPPPSSSILRPPPKEIPYNYW